MQNNNNWIVYSQYMLNVDSILQIVYLFCIVNVSRIASIYILTVNNSLI